MENAAVLSSMNVPAPALAAMSFAFILSAVVPAAAFFFLKKKFPGTKKIGVLIGALAFIVFALVLERLCHAAVFGVAGEILKANIWLYALYGGLAAGIFEETGRFLAMKYAMHGSLDKNTAIMYGIGHGGIESVILIGLPYMVMLTVAVIINHAPAEYLSSVPPDKQMVFAHTMAVAAVPAQVCMAGLERVFAFFMQLGFSYMVYRAVKSKKICLLFAAAGLHFFADASSFIVSKYASAYATEAYIMALAAAVSFFAYKFYSREENAVK